MQVILESEVYGAESFGPYETVNEAVETARNLVKSAQECFDDDGVERKVSIVVGADVRWCLA